MEQLFQVTSVGDTEHGQGLILTLVEESCPGQVSEDDQFGEDVFFLAMDESHFNFLVRDGEALQITTHGKVKVLQPCEIQCRIVIGNL